MNTLRILGIVLLLSFRLAAQCDHTSGRLSRFMDDRFQPIVARNYDGARIEWTFADDVTTNAGTFKVTKDTVLPKDFAARYKGSLYWAVYSVCDSGADVIATMSAEQEKTFRKFNPK